MEGAIIVVVFVGGVDEVVVSHNVVSLSANTTVGRFYTLPFFGTYRIHSH